MLLVCRSWARKYIAHTHIYIQSITAVISSSFSENKFITGIIGPTQQIGENDNREKLKWWIFRMWQKSRSKSFYPYTVTKNRNFFHVPITHHSEQKGANKKKRTKLRLFANHKQTIGLKYFLSIDHSAASERKCIRRSANKKMRKRNLAKPARITVKKDGVRDNQLTINVIEKEGEVFNPHVHIIQVMYLYTTGWRCKRVRFASTAMAFNSTHAAWVDEEFRLIGFLSLSLSLRPASEQKKMSISAFASNKNSH